MKLESERDFVLNLAGLATIVTKKDIITSLDGEDPYWADAISLLIKWNEEGLINLSKTGEQEHVLQEGFKEFYQKTYPDVFLPSTRSLLSLKIHNDEFYDRLVDMVEIYHAMNKKRGFINRLYDQHLVTRYRGHTLFTKEGLLTAIDELTEVVTEEELSSC